MIENFEFRGWDHELVLVDELTALYFKDRMPIEDWADNLGRLIGVKFRYDPEKGHYTEYAKYGHWIAVQTNKSTGEQIIQILNAAHANWLMREAHKSSGRRQHVPNRDA